MSFLVYEDHDLLILNKPAGVADPTTLISGRYPEILNVGGKDHGACHRLDVGTSGLVVIARKEETYQKMRELFSKNQVQKEYLAWVIGKLEKPGRIEWPIGPDPKSSKRVKVYKNVAEARRGKALGATTFYTPLKRERVTRPEGAPRQSAVPSEVEGRALPGEEGAAGPVLVTWLRIIIKTGRRHQIRAHLAAVGHPIVGDTLYKGPAADRLYLHASQLEFKHPGNGKLIKISSTRETASTRAPLSRPTQVP